MSVASATEQLAPPADLNLKDYFDVIRRRKAVFIQTFAMVLAVGIVVTALSKPIFATRAKLQVPVPTPGLTIQEASNPLSVLMQSAQPDSVATQMQMLMSSPFQQQARKRAGIKPKPGVIPPSVRVEALEGTSVILVSVEGGDPHECQRLANSVVDLHLEKMKKASTYNIDEATEFVRKQRAIAGEKLATAERNLYNFQQKYRVVEYKAREEMAAKELVDLESKVRETWSDIASTRAKIAEYRARLQKEPRNLVEETTQANPRHGKLQERLDDLKSQRLDALLEYKEGSRVIRDLDQRLASVQKQLDDTPEEVTVRNYSANPTRTFYQNTLAELEANLIGQEQDHNAAVARLTATRAIVNSAGPWEVQLNRLTRERISHEAAYTFLSDKLRDLELRSKATVELAEKIEPAALPRVPIRPRKEVNIMLSALLALFLGAGMAFLQEYLDDRVNSPEDVERVSTLPTLGYVPLMSGDQPRLVTSMAANSHIAEAYRALRSSIGFAGLDVPIRRLQVTSASKGEGKSTTAVNLATAMAMDGKKVILVDADLRRPSIHRVLELPNGPGLSELLCGMKTLDEAIQPTDIENLSVVCAGPIPPNPAELLGSADFDRIVEQLEERADILVFDTAPCIPVTDPLMVASRMDAVVLVLHIGQTRKAAIKHVVQQLSRARARIVGVVFNRVQPRRAGYDHYHYYYYSGDDYYTDAARYGERQRRNGKKRRPELESGASIVHASHARDDEA